jgi:hypothetical protein
LLNIIKNTSKTEQIDSNIVRGLNYQGSFKNIRDFHKSLVRRNIIECEYKYFKPFFEETFEKTENRIFWKESLAKLYYFYQEIKKVKYGFNMPKHYRYLISLMFEHIPKNKSHIEIVTKEKLTGNNKFKIINTEDIDKAFNHLKITHQK